MRPFLAFVVLVVFLGSASCKAHEPPGSPQGICRMACGEKAPKCSETACTRGCSLTLDRIAEHEEDHVLDCVAKASSCDDATFAACATRIGAHLDGGPPPPPPPSEDWE